jgi:hypothetical protein
MEQKISNEEFVSRCKKLSQVMGEIVLIVQNPILNHLEAYLSRDWKRPDTRTNDYIQVEGRNITNLIVEKWLTLIGSGAFGNPLGMDSVAIKTRVTDLFSEYVEISNVHWMLVKV